MSRTLSKVLVICALVVVLPLMIVGTAFAAYYSVDNIVNVAIVVDQLSPAEDVYITYNGKSLKNHKIKEGHTKTVDVIAENSVAYNFKGWYEGTENSYTTLVSTESKLSIKMDSGKNYVAVYEVVKYNVSGWEYLQDPTDQTSFTDEAPTDAKSTYIYGEKLPELSFTGLNYKYVGWRVDGKPETEKHTVADFADKFVKLINPWDEATKVTITFHNGNKKVQKELYSEENWKIPSVDDNLFKDLGIEVKAGYEYSWADSEGTVWSTINTNENLDLYLSNPTPIVFENKALTYNAEDLKSNSAVSEVSFSVADYSALDAWFNLEAKYSFWKVAGVKYGETTYTTAKTLAEAYANAPDGTFELVVEKDFTSIEIVGGMRYYAYENPNVELGTELSVYLGEDNYELGNDFTGKSDNLLYNDYAKYAYVKNLITIDDNQMYAAIKNGSGTAVKTEVKLNRVLISANGSSKFVVKVSEDMTTYEFIEACLKAYEDNFNNTLTSKQLTITGMEVCFAPQV